MRCPKCGFKEDKVIDSRSARNDAAIRRRRMCLECGYRFTTYEEIVKSPLKVVKLDKRREEFSRTKLLNGIVRACEKRPISVEQMEGVVDSIIDELDNEFDSEVSSQIIGSKVMNKLEKIDEVAFVRFASVYKRFRDVNQFLTQIQQMIGKDDI